MGSFKCCLVILLHIYFLYPNCIGFQAGNNKEAESCGQLVLSGSNVRFPWVAALVGKTNNEEHLEIIASADAAVILSPQLVAMNANRFKVKGVIKVLNLSDYTVSVNITCMKDSHEKDPNVQTVKISQIRIHPGYNMKPWASVKNDIALVHLQEPLKFDRNVHKICLPTSEIVNSILVRSSNHSYQNETSVVVSGWNKYGNGSPRGASSSSDYLGSLDSPYLFLKLNIQSAAICNYFWSRNLPNIYENRFCASVALGNIQKDCIHRDNGVAANYNGSYYFMGMLNNFFSDQGMCDARTMEFICTPTDSILKFVQDNLRCGSSQFSCSTGECIPLKFWCDGKWDCKDGSDETDLVCKDGVKTELKKEIQPHVSDNPWLSIWVSIIIGVVTFMILAVILYAVWKATRSSFKLSDEELDVFFKAPGQWAQCDDSPQYCNLITVSLFPWNSVKDEYEIIFSHVGKE